MNIDVSDAVQAAPDTEARSAAGRGDQDNGEQNLSVLIAPHLPYLRRFARALCGDQASGDAYVVSVLEALIADRTVIDLDHPPRVALYQLFHGIWSSSQIGTGGGEELTLGGTSLTAKAVARLTPRSRQMLLLTTVEEFTLEEAAAIMGVDLQEAENLHSDARQELEAQNHARVMVIEDEPIIALDLESIVGGMGHDVVGIADTASSAVALARETKPDLILADIQLADGSSGIDAVKDILPTHDVPVIFITAFPERLLTGERPEPTFLITKPFRPETVETLVSQVLFHHSN